MILNFFQTNNKHYYSLQTCGPKYEIWPTAILRMPTRGSGGVHSPQEKNGSHHTSCASLGLWTKKQGHHSSPASAPTWAIVDGRISYQSSYEFASRQIPHRSQGTLLPSSGEPKVSNSWNNVLRKDSI
jgi:hypothetical protein